MIWFSLLIPVVVFVFTLIYFKHELTAWEIALMLLAPVVIVLVCKFTCQAIQTRDFEYWGAWGNSASYFEDWNEYIHQTCMRSYPCGSDSKGNTTYCSETYDCSYVQYHPEYWQLNGSNGEKIPITKPRFEELAKRWNMRQFIELHRNFYTKDGDEYFSNWNKKRETIEPITTEHSWTNRVKASKSVFNFEKVDPTKYGLFEYPQITEGYRQINILGDTSTSTVKANTDLMYWNSVLGAKKRMRAYILVFKDKPIEAGLAQQAYWKNGKKNEFIVTVGIDKNYAIQWVHVFSWSEVEQLKVEAKNFLLGMKTLDLPTFVDWLGAETTKRFVKKNFHEFDYLSIEPPGWVLSLTFFLTAAASIVIAIFSVNNSERGY